MSRTDPVNVAASVRDRLLNVARQERRDFQDVLQDFARERFLFRLQQSRHADSLILKGAALFHIWADVPHRITRDSDFLKHGDTTTGSVEQLIREVAAIQPVVPDGLTFDDASLRTDEIREANAYRGVRARFKWVLAGARIPVQIDFGFGDVVVPPAVEVAYPTLLDLPAPVVRAYPQEAVVAEKFQAMVSLGEGNTRMKDFYDVWFLASKFRFEGTVLAAAIAATFERRRTDLPDDVPRFLSKDHAESLTSATLWRAFSGRSLRERDTDLQFADVVAMSGGFVMPVVHGLTQHGNFAGTWEPGGPWETDDGSR